MKSLKIIFSIFLISHFISAEQLYSDLSIQEQQRLEYLSDNIRCPKCSYGNISSSNAPISKDLKKEIAQMIKDGYTDDEIFNLLANRYGDYIILKTTPSCPPAKFVWYAPEVTGKSFDWLKFETIEFPSESTIISPLYWS